MGNYVDRYANDQERAYRKQRRTQNWADVIGGVGAITGLLGQVRRRNEARQDEFAAASLYSDMVAHPEGAPQVVSENFVGPVQPRPWSEVISERMKGYQQPGAGSNLARTFGFGSDYQGQITPGASMTLQQAYQQTLANQRQAEHERLMMQIAQQNQGRLDEVLKETQRSNKVQESLSGRGLEIQGQRATAEADIGQARLKMAEGDAGREQERLDLARQAEERQRNQDQYVREKDARAEAVAASERMVAHAKTLRDSKREDMTDAMKQKQFMVERSQAEVGKAIAGADKLRSQALALKNPDDPSSQMFMAEMLKTDPAFVSLYNKFKDNEAARSALAEQLESQANERYGSVSGIAEDVRATLEQGMGKIAPPSRADHARQYATDKGWTPPLNAAQIEEINRDYDGG